MHLFSLSIYITVQDYESRLEALQKQVENYFPEAPEDLEAGGRVSYRISFLNCE